MKSEELAFLAPPMGELSEIFDFGLRGQPGTLSGTANAVPPLPKGEARSELTLGRDDIRFYRFNS